MRRTCIILILMANGVFCLAGDDRPHGRIVFDETVHDFGAVPQHAALHHAFQFRSAGAGLLKIDRVHAGCGCTAVSLAQKEIAPGKTGSISATLDTQSSEGTIVKTIQVFTDDPDNKSILLQLKANVMPEIVCTPPHLDFGEITTGADPELRVKVESPQGRRFVVTGVESSLSLAKPRFERNRDGGFSVCVKIENPTPSGSFNGFITIRTDLGGAPELKVTLTGNVAARTYAIPAKLMFGVVAPGTTASREVVVRANGWDGLKVESVHAGDGLSVTAEETDPGKEWKIAVRIDGSPAPGLLKSELRIAVNDPLVKEVVVPVYAVIRDGE